MELCNRLCLPIGSHRIVTDILQGDPLCYWLDEVYSRFGETYMTRPLDPPFSKNRMAPD